MFKQDHQLIDYSSALEFPYLTQNPNVKRIYRVDPRPPDQGGTSCGTLDDREIFWDRDRGDPAEASTWNCPVVAPGEQSGGNEAGEALGDGHAANEGHSNG